ALPLLDLGLLAVSLLAEESLLANDVPFPAIGLALKQGGSFARASASHCFGRVLIHLHDVVAVDDVPGNPISLRAHRDVLDRSYGLHRGKLAEAIVLAHKHDREFPYRRQVE